MASGLRLKVFTPTKASYEERLAGICKPSPHLFIRLHGQRCLASISLQSANISFVQSTSSNFTSTIGSSPTSLLQLPQWIPTQRHILILNAIACAVAISATWLFFSAIPNLLAFKRAAELIEKQLDVTRDGLPETMADIRLSGMEISDLTMELSDLGQEITHGVRNSTRAVHLAEERLHMLSNMRLPVGSKQNPNMTTEEPITLASNVRRVKEAIVKGRSIFQAIPAMARFSMVAFFKFKNSPAKPKD